MKGVCPECNYIFEVQTCLEDDRHKARIGDISICVNCGAVNVFDEVGVKPLENFQISNLPTEQIQNIIKIQDTIRSRGRIR